MNQIIGKTTLLKIMGVFINQHQEINALHIPYWIYMGMVENVQTIIFLIFMQGFSKASVLKSLDWIIEFSD